MPVEFSRPWVGVAIPSVLILYLQASTSYIMFRDRTFSTSSFVYFQLANAMLWLSYYLAITVPAGSPPASFKLPVEEFKQPQTMWRKYCIKCNRYKPERAHHCKRCGKCILRMDHHCPWTNNCIGYKNLSHFLRFVFWILVPILIGFVYYIKKLWHVYKIRNYPAYFVSTPTLSLYIVNMLLVSFVLLTVSILFIRALSSAMINQTMIESWEWDRIQDNFFTENFWIKIRENYKMLYPDLPDPIPNLKTWKVNYRILKKDTQIPLNFTFEDLVFPYDLGSAYQNLVDSLGPIYTWLYPFGAPAGDGMTFVKDKMKEDQLNLPFPPDGGNVDEKGTSTDNDDDNELVMKNWSNYMGETLDDFGVDLDTEDYESNKAK